MGKRRQSNGVSDPPPACDREQYHVPVLLAEVLQYLDPHRGGTYIDCTLGGGGHARAVLQRIGPSGRLLGLDRDPAALAAAAAALQEFGPAFAARRTDFRHIAAVARAEGLTGGVDGILMDLGVSSHQLDTDERGFSYHADAPLDMRMNPEVGLSARDLVAAAGEDELARILRDYGEERWAVRIAKFIVEARQRQPIETTAQLVAVIKAAVPSGARRDGPHPARRTFQALRIAVNDELGALQEGLEGAFATLKPGGRLVVITFHSLEDRIVKQTMAQWTRACVCPPQWPVCRCAGEPAGRLLTKKPVLPGAAELRANPRARSAKLRAIARSDSQ